MTSDLLFAGLGLVILLLAGDTLVRGAVNLSLRIGIPAFLVSLTIVAFGTSAPELLISIKSLLDGAPGLALGNVVGSNTANVLLVLGVPALLTGLHTAGSMAQRSYIQMLMATALFIGLALTGQFNWISGIILLTALAVILWDAQRDAGDDMSADDDLEDIEGADPSLPWWQIIVFLGLGLIGLPLGADLLVDSARNLARGFGISETVIGLTLVALGTSLPELATTVMAAIRKHTEVALGNVIGSNLFNLLAVIGITSLFGTLDVPEALIRFDLWVMAASSLILLPFAILHWNMNRVAGVTLTSLYVLYVVTLL